MADVMNIHTKNTLPAPAHTAPTEVDLVSLPKMHGLLAQAAKLAEAAGLPPEAFASMAWQSYLQAFPALAEQLAQAQFDAAVEELRGSGRLAKA
jgi:hypothetical protein